MNTWRAEAASGNVEFRSSDFDEYELEAKLGLPIKVIDVTDGGREVAVILPNDDLESAFRLRVEWARPSSLGREAWAQRTRRTVRIVRGQLAGEPWGYDILDSFRKERVEHVGSLSAAETYAQGYAQGLFNADGTEVEIRFGPEGLSTRKALLEPGS